jgi:hypothetical protein
MRQEIIDAMGLGTVSFNDLQLEAVGAPKPEHKGADTLPPPSEG